MTPAESLLKAIRARGSDAQDLRDAAHEACHALQWNVRGKWTRRNIDRANPNKGRRSYSFGLADEIIARAVEQLVCVKLGAECPSIEACALTMIMEAMEIDRVNLPCDGTIERAIRRRLKAPEAHALAERVIALDVVRAETGSAA